ncbi:DMT family transporter [Cryptosporangium aurantiacum]|uniref:Permease of the drug/metabolite transporter (DMT) superfamily n=1 Tax=Cryptosporangium aurantiacum TaxID=134849 RepID=A0A1M7Q4N4_9ACTN|nr:DMT family transporter [Cryptosporangium aurantiacum]SHN25264.1 Permease of the drug/metabolite transporter (DMT) superfamily [Cryptosporangium aurantiacum]
MVNSVLARPGLGTRTAAASGATGMVFVGGSVAVSSLLVSSPLFTVQAVRYGLACLLLVVFARLARQRIVVPRGVEWLWLSGVAVTGMVMFNVALVYGSEHAEPAVLGVAVASVPVVMAAVGPLLEGARPTARVLVAALVVTGGAALVEGLGRSDTQGLVWAVVVFACEAGFTLLAVPVLGRHRPWGVSVHTTWIAALMFLAIGVLREGPTAALHLDRTELVAVGYLAVAVTALAFVLWYTCVDRLGSGRAGLLTGVAPVAAALSGIALGQPVPGVLVWVGIAVVAVGLALGLSPAGGARPPRAPRPLAVGRREAGL